MTFFDVLSSNLLKRETLLNFSKCMKSDFIIKLKGMLNLKYLLS